MNSSASLSVLEGTIHPETGKAPERRFLNPADKADGSWLHAAITKFRMVGDTKDIERKEVEAMLRHSPPYSDTDLRALGMENMPNSTMGELPRRVGDEEAKWTDYTTSSTGLWQITFPALSGQPYEEFKERASELINFLWMDDCRHVLALQLAFRQFSCYGVGPVVWTDCYDPSPIARVASDLRFPVGTRLTLDNFSECSLHDSYTPQFLYATIRGETGDKRAKLHGWNRTEVMKVLKSGCTQNGITDSMWDNLEKVELAERQGRNIWESYHANEIKVIHVFVKEYEPHEDGKCISHMVLASDGTAWRIIRDKGYEYKSPKEFTALASDRVGSDMTIAGLRGMGVDLLEHCRSMDVMHNASMYASFRSSIPVYSTMSGAGAQAADQISVRPNGVIIPQGFAEVQSHVDFQAGGWQIDRLSNLADRYQRTYDINSPNKGGVQRTAKETMYDAAKESDARSSQILPIVRLFFEPLGREFVRRLFAFPRGQDGRCLKYKGWELAQSFWDGMESIGVELGVPLIMLANYRVTINPNNTPGGMDKKLMRAQAAMAVYPTLQTAQQRNFITNSTLIAIYGYQAAKPYLNRDEVMPPPELALLLDSENADMVSGYQRRVLPEQDHLAHLGPMGEQGFGHIAFAMQKLKEIQDGTFNRFVTDPLEELAEQLRAAVVLKGHIDGHLSFLGQNPIIMEMPEVQAYFDFSAQMENILIQSMKAFEKQAAERQQQTGAGMDPKAQAIMATTQAQIEAGRAKTQAEIEMMQQKHMVKLGGQVQTAEARRDQKEAQFILDEVIKKKKAESDLMVKGANAALDLKAKVMEAETVTTDE